MNLLARGKVHRQEMKWETSALNRLNLPSETRTKFPRFGFIGG